MTVTVKDLPYVIGVQKIKSALAAGVNADGNYEMVSRLSYENLQGNFFHTGIMDALVVPADAVAKYQIDLPEVGNSGIMPRWQISFELFSDLDVAQQYLIDPIATGEAALQFSLKGKPTDYAYGGFNYSLDATGAFDLVDLATSTGEIIDGANQIGRLLLDVIVPATTAKYLVVCLRAW